MVEVTHTYIKESVLRKLPKDKLDSALRKQQEQLLKKDKKEREIVNKRLAKVRNVAENVSRGISSNLARTLSGGKGKVKSWKNSKVTIRVPPPQPIEKVKSNYFTNEYEKEKRLFLK